MADKLGVPLVEQGLKQQQELKRRGCCVDWTGRYFSQQLPSRFNQWQHWAYIGCLTAVINRETPSLSGHHNTLPSLAVT